jgi:uncharacterized membrane protein (Fun14 family)
VREPPLFFEVIQINTTDVSSQTRHSAELNANWKLRVIATVEFGEGFLCGWYVVFK